MNRLLLEAQKREAGKTRLPDQIVWPLRSVARYLTINCVEYSDAGSLPTLPRSST